MLTVEVRINGSLIGYVYCVNELMAPSGGECRYRYEYYEPERGKLTSGKVMHKQSHGAVALVKKLVDAVDSADRRQRGQ